ncbi:MAG: hypothetical protein WA093_00310 [Minisyncoccales bacterium]
MKFAVLDPRNVPAAIEFNDKVFANLVYGIEVTVPALAKRCVKNLDPQHTDGNADIAAIEVAVTAELPSEDLTLATVRADLDSVGAMAIFSMRAKGISLELAMDRISQIAIADKFARGGYPGPQSLPTRDNPWDEKTASASSSQSLAAIAAAVADFKVPLGTRVETMEKWLLEGVEPKQYRDSVERERSDLVAAIESGQIKTEVRAGGKIVVVETTHRAATTVGYSVAPVVVALNPSFKQGPGDAYRKFTVCAFEPKFADIRGALAELAKLEAGWGGSPTIGGSPQGVSSALTIDQVVEIVEKYLK